MTPMQTFDFIPADTLFCRDGRPLAAGSSFGRGAYWPLPTVLHCALRTALLRRTGEELPRGKPLPGAKRRGQQKPNQVGSDAFQWLHLHGPFPVSKTNGAWTTWFPFPRDLVPASGESGHSKEMAYLRVVPNIPLPRGYTNNLPAPLTHMLASFAPPSKADLPDWVESAFLAKYLSGDDLLEPPKPPLWDTDYRIGVEIEDASHAAASGQLFAAEHLRLRRDVRLRFRVSSPPGHKGGRDKEGSLTVESLNQGLLQLGGEQRFGMVLDDAGQLELPRIQITGPHVKWMLLTPAIFAQGWRPGWVDERGQVKLRVVDKEKRREFRRQRREAGWQYDESHDPLTLDDQTAIGATLVAACLGKPQPVGGWETLHETHRPDGSRETSGGGKPTFLAVPAGSVYYFQAASPEDARRLATVLQERCRSDFFGEKGLGLGLCGSWQHQAGTSADVRKNATASAL